MKSYFNLIQDLSPEYKHSGPLIGINNDIGTLEMQPG